MNLEHIFRRIETNDGGAWHSSPLPVTLTKLLLPAPSPYHQVTEEKKTAVTRCNFTFLRAKWGATA
jgi:hypothetical protein